MNIIFKRVHAVNFLSFEEFDINLDKQGFCLISGINQNESDNASSNGSGKSSIIESVMWALTGQTVRGVKDVCRTEVNADGTRSLVDDGCYVELWYNIDGHEYYMLRSKGHTKYKTNLILNKDGENISGKGIRDTEKIFADCFPDLTFDFISSVIILGQGLPERFSNNTPSGRKEILEKLSKSDFMIADLKEKVSARANEINKDVRSYEDEKLKRSSQIEQLKADIASIENKIANYGTEDEIITKIAQCEGAIEDIKNEASAINRDKKQVTEDLSNITNQYNELVKNKQNELSTLQNEYQTKTLEPNKAIQETNTQISLLNAEIARVRSMRDVCPTCGQKLKGIVIPDVSAQVEELETKTTELKALKESVASFDTWYQKERSEIESRYEDNQNQLKVKGTDLSNGMRELESRYNQVMAEYNQMNNEHNQLVARHTAFKTTLENLKSDVVEKNTRISVLTNELGEFESKLGVLSEHSAVLSKMSTALARDFRGYLLKSVITFIDSKTRLYSKDIFNKASVNVVSEGNNINIYYDGKEYSALSGGERQKVDLIIQLALRDMLVTYMNFSSNLLSLDELFDNCDVVGCDNMINMLINRLNDLSTIFIVTHHSAELNVPYDNQIVVVKGVDNISRIS